MQDYEILDTIYSSKTSIIHKVRNIKNNNIYALKEFIGYTNQALIEIEQLKKCQIDFVIKIKEIFKVEGNLILVMEYASQGNLKQFINEHFGNIISERIICKILIQIAYVFIFMRENKIYYKGLHPENILIVQDQIRICDFGIDNLVQCLKPNYQPPELLFQEKFSYKSMSYQLGLILYELTIQRPLIRFENAQQVKAIIQNGGAIVKLPAMYSKELRFIINSCLEIKEFDRIDIRQLIQNENFKILYNQKHITFNYDQQETFDFWSNHKQIKSKRKSVFICTSDNNNNNNEISQRSIKNIPDTKPLKIGQKLNICNNIIPKLSLKKNHDEILTLRPISQQSKYSSNFGLQKSNVFSKSNQALSSHRKIISAVSSSRQKQWIDFLEKPHYLADPIKPQQQINDLIRLKMEQCVETIGLEETRLTLNRLKAGGSVHEFLSKHPEPKFQCVAKHMQDIISFTQL